MRYKDGQEVRVGDHVEVAGKPHTVRKVAGRRVWLDGPLVARMEAVVNVGEPTLALGELVRRAEGGGE